jgi:hypothetical protein
LISLLLISQSSGQTDSTDYKIECRKTDDIETGDISP